MIVDDPKPEGNVPEFSVSELSNVLKRTVEDRFAYVRVRGELSGFKRPTSGHCYFALKDADAALDGVMWRGVAQRLTFVPADGLEVVATGKLTTFPGRSKYQMVVEHMAPAGVGALLAQLEKLKARLGAEGLFAPERKRPLPMMPDVIGVVTSPTGAVIRDILHRLNERFPRRVLLWPCRVQGEGAAAEIAAAIAGFNALLPDGLIPRPDLLIVARGGGSIEDLWAFNEEIVVRAAAASVIPLISAVGHETDTTLIDFASDKRAPTPTAAAEMAVPVRAELRARLAELALRLDRCGMRAVTERRERLRALARGVAHPRQRLETLTQRLDEVSQRLPRGLILAAERARRALDQSAQRLGPAWALRVAGTRRALDRWAGRVQPLLLKRQVREGARHLAQVQITLASAMERQRRRQQEALTSAARMLESLNPDRVLERGYARVEGSDGAVIASAAAAKVAPMLFLRFADGGVKVRAVPDGGAKSNKDTPVQPTLL